MRLKHLTLNFVELQYAIIFFILILISPRETTTAEWAKTALYFGG